MIPLWAETALLMGAAYFLGAILACVVRRSLAPAVRPAAVSAERRVDPLPEVAQQDARGARFAGTPAPAVQAPVPPPEPVRPAPAPTPQPAATVAAEPQDLRDIQGIDAGTEARLKGLGVTRYEAIAAWTAADVGRIEQALGQKGRAARENWIEQAQILAKGGRTLFSMRRARGEASTAAPSPDEGLPASVPAPSDAALPRPMSRVGVSAVVIAPQPGPQPVAVAAPPLVSERAAFAQQPRAAASAPAAVPIRPSEPPAHDNLQRIGTITTELEKRLNALGVARYSEIAQWSPAAVERFDKDLDLGGRISRENWIEQAQILSRGGDTRFSREFDRLGHLPPPPPPRPIKLPDAIREHEAAIAAGQAPAPQRADVRADLGSLRSVRSQAYQDTSEPGPDAARRAASRKIVRGSHADDLKRIRGIGVMIEKRLNSLGVVTYEDIANWTSADIERISEQLDFKGRIQRENWVEQARILAAGGDTEFSRRTDRSKV
jgi:predicted flap endonuclease-1-like 5' DNA nuclease